jgi:hypothetical protein
LGNWLKAALSLAEQQIACFLTLFIFSFKIIKLHNFPRLKIRFCADFNQVAQNRTQGVHKRLVVVNGELGIATKLS